jgi:hypothetical protein
MNIAMGEKILWRLVMGSMDRWKEAIFKKYFVGMRKRCLDSPLIENKGSNLWKLINTTTLIFQPNSNWISRNGKAINLWIDNIIGKPPLGNIEKLNPLKN